MARTEILKRLPEAALVKHKTGQAQETMESRGPAETEGGGAAARTATDPPTTGSRAGEDGDHES
jgi:hypothetical protein